MHAWRLLSAGLLFVLYTLGSTQLGFVHQLFHPGELTATHTAVQEKNPCHRNLYHGERSGCNHEYHLAKLTVCNFCHTFIPADQIVFSTDGPEFIHLNEREFIVGYSFVLDPANSQLLARGPPLV